MLVIRCASCKKKLWRYDKIGPGEVLRCHKARIAKWFIEPGEEEKLQCACGRGIAIDKGAFYKMIPAAFTYSGTKRNG